MEMQKAGRALALLFDGVCRVYELKPAELSESGLRYADEWRPLPGEQPCHLAFLQAGPASLGVDGSKITAKARLFLPPEAEAGYPKIKPGSLLEICQNGRVYRLGACGLPVCYQTHRQLELAALPEERA